MKRPPSEGDVRDCSLADILEKIVRGEEPELGETRYVIDVVFRPVCFRYRTWLIARYGRDWTSQQLPGYGSGEDGTGGDDDYAEEDIGPGENGEEEGDVEEGRPDSRRFGGQDRRSISEPSVELWNEFSIVKGPAGTAWEKALAATADQPDAVVRDKELARYLKQVAVRELERIVGIDRTVSRSVYERVSQALGSDTFQQRDGMFFPKGKPWPREAALWEEDPRETATALLSGIELPPPKGWSDRCDYPLPTAAQIAEVIGQLMTVRRVSLDIEMVWTIVMTGYNPGDAKVSSLTVSGDSDINDPEDRGIGEKDTEDREPGPLRGWALDAEVIIRQIETAIEEIDGCPLDPSLPAEPGGEGKDSEPSPEGPAPPPRGKPRGGRLGRLFLELFLWMHQRLDSGLLYGFEAYRKITGFPVSTEQDRMEKVLIPLLEGIFKKYSADEASVSEVLEKLREKYFHRKPEIVAWPGFESIPAGVIGNREDQVL